MYRRISLLVCLIFCLSAGAQDLTTVTGTVTDSDSILWFNGTWSAVLQNPVGGVAKYLDGSGPVPTQFGPFSLGAGGSLSQSIPNNLAIGPAGTTWVFTFCPYSSATCSQLAPMTISGATQSITGAISAGIKPPRFPAIASQSNYGYSDVEITPAPLPGGTYYNVSVNCTRQWNANSSTWACLGTGGGGAPGGQNLQFQYNNGGTFGGSQLQYYNTLYGPNTKLPRVNVMHPDFSMGGPITAITLSSSPTCSGGSFTISIGPPPAGGTQASATGICTGGVPYVAVYFPGGGYTTPPSVSFTGLPGVTGTAVIGCSPGAPDPTGTLDSSCAIQNAIDWAYVNEVGALDPSVYIPIGIYNINTNIKIPCWLHIWGDGSNSTILIATHDDGENAVTLYPPPTSPGVPDFYTCGGTMQGIAIGAKDGHLFPGNLLEAQFVVGYNGWDIRLFNGGGRGLFLTGSTERTRWHSLKVDNTRWSVINGNQNENHFDSLLIDAGGQDSSGYCYTRNCINGIFPSFSWTLTQSLTAATANGTLAAFTITGGNNGGTANGVSPLLGAPFGQVMPLAVANISGSKITSITWITNGAFYSTIPDARVDACQGTTLVPQMSGGTITGIYLPPTGGGNCTIASGTAIVEWTGGGNWFSIANIADLTGLNGTWRAQNVFNNCSAVNLSTLTCSTSSANSYVITTPSNVSGTSTLGGSPAFAVTIAPVNEPGSLTFGGATDTVMNFSDKTNWYLPCISVLGGASLELTHGYCESAPPNGLNIANSDLHAGGLTFRTYLTQAISNGVGKVNSSLWSMAWNDNAAYAASQHVIWQVRIMPQDYVIGSTTCSVYVTTPTGGCVQQGQVEIANWSIDPQGDVFLSSRNQSGTTVPLGSGSINWPIGTMLKETLLGNIGTELRLTDMHWRTMGTSNVVGGKWNSICNDANSFICSTIQVGEILDLGYNSTGHSTQSVVFVDNEFIVPVPTPIPAYRVGMIKMTSNANIKIEDTNNGGATVGSAAVGQIGGQLQTNTAINGEIAYGVQYANGTSPTVSILRPQIDKISSFLGSFADTFNTYQSAISSNGIGMDGILSSNPDKSVFNGTQYEGSYCFSPAPAGNIATATSISSTTTQVTVLMPNSFIVGQWIALGFSARVNYTAGFTSTLGGLVNNQIVQLQTGTSSSQIVFNFANAGFSGVADTGTAYPVAETQLCQLGGPTNYGANAGYEYNVRAGGNITTPTWNSIESTMFTDSTMTAMLKTLTGSYNMTGILTAGQGGSIAGTLIGFLQNYATWSTKVGYETGAGCTTNCWTQTGTGVTVAVDSTDFADPNGTFTTSKVFMPTPGQTIQDFNGLSLTSGQTYSLSLSACMPAASGVHSWVEGLVGTSFAGGNWGFNMPVCSSTTPTFIRYCGTVVPTASLTQTVQLQVHAAIGSTSTAATAYIWGATLVQGSNCGLSWATGGTPFTSSSLAVQTQNLNGSLTDPTQGTGMGVFSSGGALTSTGGTTVVLRCTTAGTLPVGALTTVAANCGASTATGLLSQ